MSTLVGGFYYQMQLSVTGASSGAYYYAQFTDGQISNGGAVTIRPTAAGTTWVSIQASLSVQAPPGSVSAGITVTTANGVISGSIGVSPAVNVPVTATLYGFGSQIGSVTIPAGQTSANFSWNVDQAQAIPADQVSAQLAQAEPQPEAQA